MMISVIRINLGLQNIVWMNINSIWYTSMDLNHGYCHTFDLSQIPELKYVGIGIESRHNPEMRFKFKKQSEVPGTLKIFFHEPFGIIHK